MLLSFPRTVRGEISLQSFGQALQATAHSIGLAWSMIDWEALSAIGTVGALWFAVVQSSRTGRADRMRAIGTLRYLGSLTEPIELVSIYEDTTDEDLRNTPRDQIEGDLQIVRRAKAGLSQLPLSEAAHAGVVEWTMTLPLALRDIESALESRHLPPYSPAESSIRYVQEATAHFNVERARLEAGLITRFLNLRRSR